MKKKLRKPTKNSKLKADWIQAYAENGKGCGHTCGWYCGGTCGFSA